MNYFLPTDLSHIRAEINIFHDVQPFPRQESVKMAPLEKDVICGRGAPINMHPGNVIFRKVVQANKGLYHSCEKNEKFRIAQSIVEALEDQDPPIRFLVLQNSGSSHQVWNAIPKSKAIRKTVQALREKPKSLRYSGEKRGGREGNTTFSNKTTLIEEIREKEVKCQLGQGGNKKISETALKGTEEVLPNMTSTIQNRKREIQNIAGQSESRPSSVNTGIMSKSNAKNGTCMTSYELHMLDTTDEPMTMDDIVANIHETSCLESLPFSNQRFPSSSNSAESSRSEGLCIFSSCDIVDRTFFTNEL